MTALHRVRERGNTEEVQRLLAAGRMSTCLTNSARSAAARGPVSNEALVGLAAGRRRRCLPGRLLWLARFTAPPVTAICALRSARDAGAMPDATDSNAAPLCSGRRVMVTPRW